MTAEQERVYLKLEIRKLRQENAGLRRRLGERSRHRRRIEKALDDARLLLLWKGAGLPTSQSFAQQQASMGRRRWQNAIGLLRLARLVDFDWSWSLGAHSGNERALAVAVGRAIASRQSFLMRLPVHGQQTGQSRTLQP